jgi:hypothetical protein
MSSIISYPSATPELADLLLGTKYDQDTNPTKNFSISGIRNVIADNTPVDADLVMTAFSTEDTIGLTEEATTVAVGPAQSNTIVTLSSEGVFTFNTDGAFVVKATVNFGSSDYITPGQRYVLFATFVNGSQYGAADVTIVNEDIQYSTKEYTFVLNLSEGDTLQFKIATSGIGEEMGGVFAFTEADPFENIPAISVMVRQLKLV